MALTAPLSRLAQPSTPARDMPAWAAAILAVVGNVVAFGVVAAAAVGVIAAAALTFGAGFLAQL